MLKRFVSSLPKGQFVRQAMTVMLGSSAAQLIAIAASPAIARLYAPSDFGQFALYSSLVVIASSLATGRYDVAVMLSRDDDESNHLTIGALAICACTSLFMLLALLFLSPIVAGMLGVPGLASWLKLMPFAVFLAGTCSALSYWCSRHAKYRILTESRIAQAAITSSIAIVFGFMWPAGGLYLSALGGYLICAFLLLYAASRSSVGFDGQLIGLVTDALRRYKKFPLMSIPTDLVSQLSGQLPRFFMGIYFGSTALGLFFLNQRVLDLPLGVVAGSVREVFGQRAARQYQLEGACEDTYIKTFKHLLLIAVLPSGMVFVFAPDVFAMIFGERWREAGDYSRIMVPMYFFRFCISPLCMMFYIAQKQQQELLWQLTLLVFTCISFAVGVFKDDAKIGLSCYSLMYCMMYVFIFFMALRLARGGGRVALQRSVALEDKFSEKKV
jgi:O-antigen/teichoic acid export membrane protein